MCFSTANMTKIRVKCITGMLKNNAVLATIDEHQPVIELPETPKKTPRTRKPLTVRKTQKEEACEITPEGDEPRTTRTAGAATTCKKKKRGLHAEPSPSQKRIDTYFRTCAKSYTIERERAIASAKNSSGHSKTTHCTSANSKVRKGRKRLLTMFSNTTSESGSLIMTHPKTKLETYFSTKPSKLSINKEDLRMLSTNGAECIDLSSEGEVEPAPATADNGTSKNRSLDAITDECTSKAWMSRLTSRKSSTSSSGDLFANAAGSSRRGKRKSIPAAATRRPRTHKKNNQTLDQSRMLTLSEMEELLGTDSDVASSREPKHGRNIPPSVVDAKGTSSGELPTPPAATHGTCIDLCSESEMESVAALAVEKSPATQLKDDDNQSNCSVEAPEELPFNAGDTSKQPGNTKKTPLPGKILSSESEERSKTPSVKQAPTRASSRGKRKTATAQQSIENSTSVGANSIKKRRQSSKPAPTKRLSVEAALEAPSTSAQVQVEQRSLRSSDSNNNTTNMAAKVEPAKRQRKPRPVPDYKVVDGTTFAVDAFQFGRIEGVTHYFLSHFHADHYVGLTRKFDMPLYLSPITARLVRTFVPIEERFIHEMPLGEPLQIGDIQVTTMEANHCPGAVMFLFKFPTGRCVLHTGDFRAHADMESEPLFWNNDIDTVYLDTTYISDKYAFCQQTESIDRAIRIMHDFRAKHAGKRVLCVCGAYLIGKERFWAAMAREFNWHAWTESNRRRALDAMQLQELEGLLCDDPVNAELHVLSIGKLSYQSLLEYFQQFTAYYDLLIAFRPSGWEKHSRPQYRGQINIVGIEYSEHSSHMEMRRFVSYLKPREVISTVPVGGKDLRVTPKIPPAWYRFDKLQPRANYQPSIRSYLNGRVSEAAAAKSERAIMKKRPAMTTTPLKQANVSPMKSTTGAIAGSPFTVAGTNKSNDLANNSFGEEQNTPPTQKAMNNPLNQHILPAQNTYDHQQQQQELSTPVKGNHFDITADADDDWLT